MVSCLLSALALAHKKILCDTNESSKHTNIILRCRFSSARSISGILPKALKSLHTTTHNRTDKKPKSATWK